MALQLNFNALGLLFPAFIVTDYGFSIKSFGPSIRRVFPEISPGAGLWDHFVAERPIGEFDVARLLNGREQVWLRGSHGLNLRGIIVDQGDELYFLINYAPTSLRSDAAYQLQMWDFSPADASLDALIAVEVHKALIVENQELLKSLSAAKDAAEASQQATQEYYTSIIRDNWTPTSGARGEGQQSGPAVALTGPESVPASSEEGSRQLFALAGSRAADARSSGEQHGDTPALDPLQVIADICQSREALFRAKGIALQIDLDNAGEHFCAGDPVRLRDAVTRMLDHALARTASGWVKIHASAHPDGPDLRLLVECLDTGASVDDDATVVALLDAGVLAAEAAGGKLNRWSLRGVGVKTELQIAYPRVIAKGRGQDGSRSTGGLADGPPFRRRSGDLMGAVSAENPLRILVVSSDPLDLRLMEVILVPPAVEIVMADSTRRAVELCLTETIDAVLLDLQSLGVDGLSTAKKIREAEAELLRPPTPLAIMSHKVVIDHLDRDASTEIDAFLFKPIVPVDLIDLLSSLTGRSI